MSTFRLIVHRHDRLLGHFESGTPWSMEAMRDISERLHTEDGYQLELQYAHGERRLLESTPTGIRLISAEPLFKPVDMTTLSAA